MFTVTLKEIADEFQLEIICSTKKLEDIEFLAERLLETGIDRSGFILGIGGGVVSDISGFLASIYMRGVRCAFVSSTLLSQVDSSVGGKVAVNHALGKNLIGAFYQPRGVMIDPQTLRLAVLTVFVILGGAQHRPCRQAARRIF